MLAYQHVLHPIFLERDSFLLPPTCRIGWPFRWATVHNPGAKFWPINAIVHPVIIDYSGLMLRGYAGLDTHSAGRLRTILWLRHRYLFPCRRAVRTIDREPVSQPQAKLFHVTCPVLCCPPYHGETVHKVVAACADHAYECPGGFTISKITLRSLPDGRKEAGTTTQDLMRDHLVGEANRNLIYSRQ